MSEIDDFLLSGTNPAANRYTVKPEGFKAMRKRVNFFRVPYAALIVSGGLVYVFLFS